MEEVQYGLWAAPEESWHLTGIQASPQNQATTAYKSRYDATVNKALK